MILLLCVSLLLGCAHADRAPAEAKDWATTAFVVSHGWHSGIVLRRSELPPSALPEAADFPGAEYIEIGWGDRDYYPARSFNLWYGIKAIAWPTPSLLHVVGLTQHPAWAFPASEVVALPLSREGFARLAARITASFEREGDAKARPVAPGLYGGGRFYPSRERFHLFKTCNVWTARVLREGGVAVPACLSLMPECVLEPARQRAATARE